MVDRKSAALTVVVIKLAFKIMLAVKIRTIKIDNLKSTKIFKDVAVFGRENIN